jgi:hypothetical protein
MGEAVMGGCFVAGTLVSTENGLVEIQNVKAWDRVWSRSMLTGEWELRSVESTPIHDFTGDVVTIQINNVTIDATGNHPFWVVSGSNLVSRPSATDVPEEERTAPSGRWVEARSIKLGDTLLLLSDQTAEITALSTRQAQVLVYNLRVESNHTYAVSQAGILVHNKGMQVKPVPRAGTRGRPDHQADVAGPGRAQADAQAGPGETVLTEEPVRGYPGVNRRADNQIVGANGKTRLTVESERRPNGSYHKERVNQLESHGIEVQTRPIPPAKD